MGYKYQMHTHTAPCSACASMTPAELAKALHEGGYSGAVITNHFMGGNTGINRALPWEQFVQAYETDYNACKREAQQYGLDLIFGIEEHIDGGREILAYGITPKDLYDNPQLANHKIEDWLTLLRKVGGLCIQAHPYRDRFYVTKPWPFPLEQIDGIEVFNYFNTPSTNDQAAELAKEHPELILITGADTHQPSSVAVCGIETNERITDGKQLVAILRSGTYRLLLPQ